MRMNSSHETKLHRLFRMKGEIYQEADLNICLKNLKLQETDLVITSNSQMKKIKETNALGKAVLLNMDAYGTKEPKEEWVDDILKVANAYPYKRIIAIGGGTVIDVSKLCVFGDGRSVQELYSDKREVRKTRELIALPTTCGTGSEVTNVSVVEFPSLHSKLGLQMDALFPDKAILIGELLTSLPLHSHPSMHWHMRLRLCFHPRQTPIQICMLEVRFQVLWKICRRHEKQRSSLRICRKV